MGLTITVDEYTEVTIGTRNVINYNRRKVKLLFIVSNYTQKLASIGGPAFDGLIRGISG